MAEAGLGTLGKLRKPFPTDECGAADCGPLGDDAYLFNDLETGKLIVFCEEHAMYVELNRRDRWVLVAL